MRCARVLSLSLSALAVAALSVGCAEVADSARQAAGDAASQVASDVAQTARMEAVKAICAPVKDGTVSAADVQALSGWVLAAGENGVPAEITAPLREIAEAGDKAPAGAVTALGNACDSALAQ
ncbi:hypothetical protein NCCP1664_17220 [Zafaria cholistanensis]|uniref:Lipoprotein n=1 Tax=Zafaria cholistanensis TaxID=1682741 RepID=A0A5A7NRN8_9MICC|nr:hypothetical protein [Zafaria cholistanensis]GER23226.1 hypothetical protein NCCP1664_17220 [Zafaria cholistanensis]